MRLSSFFALPLVCAVVVGASAACLPGGDVCNCPATGIPQVVVALPCGVTELPTMTLSGVCAGTATQTDGQLAFGSTEPGTCDVELTYAGGTTYTTSVEFSGEWRACGSDPHGCGELVKADGLPSSGFESTLAVGPACSDGGPGDGGTSDGSADGGADATRE